jgi:2-methylisocitrate lyase-like PEP mutase family enzyme
MIEGARKLRELLAKPDLILAPGAYDCITARTVARAGFPACYMTGSGTAAALGYPDYGLVTMSEMADNAGRIAGSIDLPVIADADTGYGNELNVTRTVREYERRGVAALHIEDQDFPKKCGHLEKKAVIALDAYLPKIRAAAAARRNPDFVIIARTDSRGLLGFDEAVRRANAALEAGADVAFVEAPQTLDEVAAVPKLVRGPCLLNIVWRGKTPEVPFADAAAMGYRIAILPSILLKTIYGIGDSVLAEAQRLGRHPVPPGDIDIREGFRRVGADDWDRISEQFRAPTASETK